MLPQMWVAALSITPERCLMEDSSEIVLLIEEDMKLAKLFSEALEAAHIRNYRALGTNAVDRAAAWKPDLVLLHFSSGLDGPALLTRLTQDERTAAIPVVVLSGNTERRVIDRLTQRGARDCWAIPEIVEGPLVEHVKDWLATHNRAKPPQRHEAMAQPNGY
jgi:CheY-like chemotaxis protein